MSSNSTLKKAGSFLSERFRLIFFFLIDRLVPARKDYWAFATWHGEYAHTIDNPRAVFELIKDDASIRKVLLRKRGQNPATSVVEGTNVTVVNVESLRGAWLFARSKYLLLGYGLAGVCSYSRLLSRKHKVIQLWHGIPLKRIGKLFPGEPHWNQETPRYTATVCSSERDQEIMAAAFDPLNKHSVWLTGLPRNDTILKPEGELSADYKSQLKRLRDALRGRRFILYAPTWRASENGIYAFSDAELDALRATCSKHNAVFGIRAHANRRLRDNTSADPSSPIIFVNDYPDVNVLLRETDVLVTDYSSIYIDFLITGRPILPFTYDVDSYVQERGFLYSLDEALPAPCIRGFGDLLVHLEGALRGALLSPQQYAASKALFHSHADNAGAQVVAKIKALNN